MARARGALRNATASRAEWFRAVLPLPTGHRKETVSGAWSQELGCEEGLQDRASGRECRHSQNHTLRQHADGAWAPADLVSLHLPAAC